MLDLYYAATPNGRKALMTLVEVGLPYRLRWVDLEAGEQHEPAFQAVSPNGRIPALVDDDGPDGRPIALFESGAILLHLAERTGLLLGDGPRERIEVLKWLFWQTSSFGPVVGQATHFVSYASRRGIESDYARQRFVAEARRLYRVLDTRLAEVEFVAGPFSIADIAIFPWVRVARGHGIEIAEYPRVAAWSDRIAYRPSAKAKPVRPGTDRAFRSPDPTDARTWQALFGNAEERIQR